MKQNVFENIPDSFLIKWQEIADLIANLINVPAALIMKTENEFMEVFSSSKTENNPYNIGDKENWHGLYCETVIKTQKKLRVPNALKDKNWDKNPDIKLGMIAYLGFPINFPDDTPFGTICVLDSKQRQFSTDNEKLLLQFKKVVELDLALIISFELEQDSGEKEVIRKLLQKNSDYQSINEEYVSTNEELKQSNDELLEAKQKAEENEEKLRSIYRVAPTGIGVVSDRILKDVNPCVCDMTGYTKDELLNKNARILYPSQEEYEFVGKEKYEQIRKTGTGSVESRWQKKDGTIINVLLSSTPIERNDYSKGVTFTALDITDRKQAEEALRESETRFQKMLGVIPDMISIQNPEMDILYSNWKGFAAVPKSRQKLNTKCYKTFRNFDDICHDCLAKSVLETKKGVQEEVRLPDGKWFDVRVIPILDKDDNVEMFMEWVRDITDRKQAEEALRSNYALLQIAGETARFGGWSVDLEKNICTWSDAVADIHEMPHGYAPSVQEAINFYAPEWHDEITQVFNNCAQRAIPYNEEMEIITSKGKRVWVRTNGRPVRDKNGKIIKVQGSFQDITKRKQAEEALKDSAKELKHQHELLNYIIKHNRSAVAVHDRDLKYIYVSQRYIDVFNVKDPNVIGKHHYEVFPDLPQKWRDVHQKALAGEVHSAEEDPFYHEDGSVEWTRWECRPWYESDGSIGGIIIYTEVITERKQREQLLTEQKELLSAIYRNAPLIMMVVNSERRVQQINGYATQFAGKDTEEMIGWRSGEALRCVHALDDPKGCGFGDFCQRCVIRNSILDTLETGKTHLQEEAPYYIKGENDQIREMTFMTSTTLIKVKGERMVLVTLQNITERQKAEKQLKESESNLKIKNEELRQTNEELIEAKEKAEESDRLKTAFLQNISHEIRTPMNGIAGFAELLTMPGLSVERCKKFTDIIISSSQQLLSIIEDIIKIATIETGQEKVNKNLFSVNHLLNEIKMIYDSKIDNTQLELFLKPGLKAAQSIVETDEVKLKQVISNLTGNAVKFTPKGYIALGYKLKDNFLEFFVEDTGIGIDAKYHNKLFERFWQAETSLTREYGGTGLGLSITKAYVELLGGKIWLKSFPGKGSIFSFTIPYTPVSFTQQENESKEKNHTNLLKDKTILIAEDEEVNYLYFKEILKDTKMMILRAINGKQAVEIAQKKHLDLILMDIKMPVMDGLEATRKIREIKPELPIIAQTAYIHSQDKEQIFDAGCDDFISKPIKKDKLLTLIKNFCT